MVAVAPRFAVVVMFIAATSASSPFVKIPVLEPVSVKHTNEEAVLAAPFLSLNPSVVAVATPPRTQSSLSAICNTWPMPDASSVIFNCPLSPKWVLSIARYGALVLNETPCEALVIKTTVSS